MAARVIPVGDLTKYHRYCESVTDVGKGNREFSVLLSEGLVIQMQLSWKLHTNIIVLYIHSNAFLLIVLLCLGKSDSP